MSEPGYDIDDLIGRVLAGEATTREKQDLDAWVSKDSANQAYYVQIKTIFDRASHIAPLNFDTDAAWRRVKRQLKSEPSVRRMVPVDSHTISVTAAIRMAASIVIVIGIGFVTYRWLNQPVQTFALRSDRATVQDTLPDGSAAFLNKKSNLSFEYNPRTKTRTARLEGEGYFEVKHEESKPFIISAEEVLIQDIGTAFNVKAYPEKDTIEVSVQQGEVHFYTLYNPGLDLTAGETGIYSKRMHEFYRLEKADTNVLAYKTRTFNFNNTDLGSVIQKVNEVYGSSIILENPSLKSCRLTVNFHGEPLDTIVEVIAETLKLTVTRKGEQILLNGSGCN